MTFMANAIDLRLVSAEEALRFDSARWLELERLFKTRNVLMSGLRQRWMTTLTAKLDCGGARGALAAQVRARPAPAQPGLRVLLDAAARDRSGFAHRPRQQQHSTTSTAQPAAARRPGRGPDRFGEFARYYRDCEPIHGTTPSAPQRTPAPALPLPLKRTCWIWEPRGRYRRIYRRAGVSIGVAGLVVAIVIAILSAQFSGGTLQGRRRRANPTPRRGHSTAGSRRRPPPYRQPSRARRRH